MTSKAANHEIPAKGGSYMREKDGSLRLVERTEQVNVTPTASLPIETSTPPASKPRSSSAERGSAKDERSSSAERGSAKKEER